MTVQSPSLTSRPSPECKSPVGAPVWQASDLFQGRNEIVIQHAGQKYRLRVTQQNKLILTK